MISSFFKKRAESELVLDNQPSLEIEELRRKLDGKTIGLIAGNGSFPLTFIKEAKKYNCDVVSICYEMEASQEVAELSTAHKWIKVGELGKLIRFFKEQSVSYVAMAGGIDRVRLFGNVSFDARGAAFMLRIRSMKDDVIMRGIATELGSEDLTVVSCTLFLSEQLAPLGVLTSRKPSKEETEDIEIGRRALMAMSSEHIGQMVVVRDGVVVAVEAVEGTDRCIARGGELGGKGSVVIKCAKLNQDMRFDVPTIGIATIEAMQNAKAKVLAIESGRTLLLDRDAVIEKANKLGISIIGIPELDSTNTSGH